MGAALSQYEVTMGEEFPTVPQLLLVEDDDFWAEVEIRGETLVISVTEGLIKTVSTFWGNIIAKQDSAPEHDPIPGTANDLIHTSLVWLLLHELHHYQMGHFDITGRLNISEAKDGNSFGALTRASQTLPPALANVPPEDLPKVEPFLEMQADHDAIEMVLDAYSPDGWHIIRARTAAIAAMMVLIEREDAKRGHDLTSHPKAATRVFQLIGHVMQMPKVEEIIAKQHPELGIDPHIPSEEELTAFNRQVGRTTYSDAVRLGHIAEAQSIVDVLTQTNDFFRDIQTAQFAQSSGTETFKTSAAKQWFGLLHTNRLVSR